MKALKVTTLAMSGSSLDEQLVQLLEHGGSVKISGIQSHSDWQKVRAIARRLGVHVAESDSEAYLSPPPKNRDQRPAGKSQRSMRERSVAPPQGSTAKADRPMAKLLKQFLVIEDNADDALLIKRAFVATGSCHAFVARNLSEAKAYLQGAGMYENRQKYPFPNAVVCDMHLGLESGLDFLQWVRETDEFKSMPVMILTGAATTRECVVAKERGAFCVLRKPGTFDDLQTMVQDMAAKLCG